jgi:carbamate kinase
MRVVIALGGNALLRRGQALTAENQKTNVKNAALSIAAVIKAGHEVVISHGNGPQIGMLALQSAISGAPYPLDVLNAETVGMIGYLIERELANLFPEDKLFATLLTQIEVDPKDPAFLKPTKPIGPVYERAEAEALAKTHGWSIGSDGGKFRRVVASPAPQHIFGLEVVRLLADRGVTVICAGGGGIPVIRSEDGSYAGIEAVIDKDHASAKLANAIQSDVLLMLTDVDGVYQNWGMPDAMHITHMTDQVARQHVFAAGSMGPKVEAAASFIEHGGKLAGIGKLEDALAIIEGKAGTIFEGN